MASASAVFRTKVDRWLAAIILAGIAFGLWVTIAAFRTDPDKGLVPLVLLIAILLLVGGLIIPTEYAITECDLVIRSGRLRTRIPLTSIERIYPTSNALAGPAWSLDRLGIDYRSGGQRRLVLISPVRRSEFLSLIRAGAGMEGSGSRLFRTGVVAAPPA